jgi:simple sugar transport system ATP-binding protein
MAPLLKARGLSRSFGHVGALDDASFDVEAGEVVALTNNRSAR